MSDGQSTPATPPETPATPPGESATAADASLTGTDSSAIEPAATPPAGKSDADTGAKPGISRTALIWMGVAVVVLSFVASFLGATLARTVVANEAVPVAT